MRPGWKALEDLATWVDAGKLKLVVGRKARRENLEAVIHGCDDILMGEGYGSLLLKWSNVIYTAQLRKVCLVYLREYVLSITVEF